MFQLLTVSKWIFAAALTALLSISTKSFPLVRECFDSFNGHFYRVIFLLFTGFGAELFLGWKSLQLLFLFFFLQILDLRRAHRRKTKQNETKWKTKKKTNDGGISFCVGFFIFFLGYFVRLFHFSLAALIFLALLHAVPCGGPSESILPSFTEFFLIQLSLKIFSLLQIETAIGWRPIEFYEQPGS